MEAEKIAEKLRDNLKKYDDFEGLYLYGSHVKEKANKYSDIDIAAIFKKDETYNNEILEEAWDLEIENDVIIDFHRVTPADLEINYIYSNEIKKGIYYAR
ncbi:MAG: nucleotidyltransferase domain-containing protein [bacterium]